MLCVCLARCCRSCWRSWHRRSRWAAAALWWRSTRSRRRAWWSGDSSASSAATRWRARTAAPTKDCTRSLALCAIVCSVCLEQVTALHPISQQFQLIQISFKNPSVCSSLISTVLLPPSDHRASDSSLALDYCACYQEFVCMCVCNVYVRDVGIQEQHTKRDVPGMDYCYFSPTHLIPSVR